ncbi:MAG TPA: hypothetical protein P5123_04140 [Spirochaetota bacterium]|nr:hypothetical protein [Spirochaetota bacterium]
MKKIFLILLVVSCARQVEINQKIEPEKPKETGAVCIRLSLPLKNIARFHDPDELYIYSETDVSGELIKSDYHVDDRFYFFELVPGRYHIAVLEYSVNDADVRKGYYLLTKRSSVESAFSVISNKLYYPGELSGIFLRYTSANSDIQADRYLEYFIPESAGGAFYLSSKGKDTGHYKILSNTILFYPFDDNTVSIIKRDITKLSDNHKIKNYHVVTSLNRQ